MKELTGGHDVERIFVRDALLEAASDALYKAVQRCAKQMPMEEIAGFIEGDTRGVSRVRAGSRSFIEAAIGVRFPGGEVDAIAAKIQIYEPGYIPCAFAVQLADGAIDVSILALTMHPRDEETPPTEEEAKREAVLDDYERERDAVLLVEDLTKLRQHLAKYGRPDALQAPDDVMRIAWHKGRSAAMSLPRAERRRSIKWLEKRGYKALAKDPGEEPS
jgi:hypothetical protein